MQRRYRNCISDAGKEELTSGENIGRGIGSRYRKEL